LIPPQRNPFSIPAAFDTTMPIAMTPSPFSTERWLSSGTAHNSTAAMESATQPKRVRLSLARGSLMTRCANAETSLEVDLLMLDYLADRCIQASLRCRAKLSPLQRNAAFQAADEALHIVNDLLTLFPERHPQHNLATHDPELRFRLLLLKFTVLFTQRYRPSRGRNGECCAAKPSAEALKKLREQNTARARKWIASAERLPTNGRAVDAFEKNLPLPQRALDEGREKVLEACGQPEFHSAGQYRRRDQDVKSEDDHSDDQDSYYGDLSTTLTLLDMLPLFMQVCAACHAFMPEGSPMTFRLMKLYREFALQSCIEQYLVLGASGTDCIDEAFAWCLRDDLDDDDKHPGISSQEDDDSFSALEIENMLRTAEEDPDEDEDGYPVPKWSMFLTAAVDRLFPPSDAERIKIRSNDNVLHTHLYAVSLRIPWADTDASILKFLSALASSGDADKSSLLPQPVLAQLERGQLDGMTEDETRDFLENTCGLNLEREGLDVQQHRGSHRTRGVDFLEIPGTIIDLHIERAACG
jgi:hypothetical protein